MARRLEIRAFNPSQPVYARKGFRANGKAYSPGDEFDWRRCAVAQRRVRQMYDAGLLRHGTEQPAPMSIRARNMDSSHDETSVQAEDVYPKHLGGPWYALSNGEKVMGKARAEQAEANL